MMKLKVQATETNTDAVKVIWFAGLSNNGMITIRVSEQKNRISIAELTAARFLLLEKRVFGRAPSCGQGLALEVSEKTFNDLSYSTQNRELKFTSQFLTTQLQGLSVSGGAEIYGDLNDKNHDEIGCYDSPYPTFNTPTLGTVAISQHALQRFQERHSHGDIKAPWRSLRNQLSHPSLTKHHLSEKTRFQKLLRYGEDDSQVWSNPTGNLYFQLIKSEKHLLLVTVFSKLSHSFADLRA
ncbi:TPA: hypothetical protein KD846_003263 [Vibrio alginolyticus]|nr:hypothetical protein [Vibrio alginolyticus]